jgi:glycosyltransferase involved in cell wall biosynthesis
MRSQRFLPNRSEAFRLHARRVAKAVSKGGRLDAFEMEESFGIVRHVQSLVHMPVVCRLHGPYFIGLRHLDRAPNEAEADRAEAELQAFRSMTAVTAPSGSVLAEMIAKADYAPPLSRVIPNPIAVTPNPVDWAGDAARRVLFVGRLTYPKGADVLAKAIPEVLKSHPTVQFTIAGPDDGMVIDGERSGTFRSILNECVSLDDRRRVTILGQQTPAEIAALRQRHGITIIASRHENFPYALIEAMGAGSAVVTSAYGGGEQVVDEGTDGFIYPPTDPQALAAAVSSLLEAPSVQERMGNAGRSKVQEKFSTDAVGSKLEEFYREVIEKASQTESVR